MSRVCAESKVFIDQYPALYKKFQERVARRALEDALQEERQAAEKERQRKEQELKLLEVCPEPEEPPIAKKPLTARRRQSLERQKFLRSVEWLEVRKVIFARDGKVCAYCGSMQSLQIDHIKPRSKFPELALDQANLQVLCWPCNKKKAAKC